MHITETIKLCTPGFIRKYIDRIEKSPIGYRLAKGAFWSFVGAVLSRGLILLASIIIARILGKAIFGELGIIQSTIGMFGVLAGFGLNMTATKYVAEFREKDPDKAGRIIVLSEITGYITAFIMMIALIIFAPLLATKTLAAPHLANLLRIGAILLFVNTLNGIQTGSLAGFEAFKRIANINFWVGILSFPILLAGVYLLKLYGVVWGMIVVSIINYLFNYIAIQKEAKKINIPLIVKSCFTETNILFDFSLPAFLSGIMVLPVAWICNAILVNQPKGYAEMGIFNAANQWRVAILFIPSTISNIILPLLTNLYSINDRDNFRKVLIYNIYFNGLITLFFSLIIIVLSKYIMNFYGQGFENGYTVLSCLVFSAVLISANNIIGQAIISMGKMWIGLLFNALWGISLLILSFSLIKINHNALSLAMAILISYFLHSIWQILYLRSIIKH